MIADGSGSSAPPVAAPHLLAGVSTPRVYCAGKIRKGDWRDTFFPGVREAQRPDDVPPVGGLSYAGPFFVSDDHGCAHGPGSHGILGEDAGAGPCLSLRITRAEVPLLCLAWLGRADVVFAWLAAPDAYGTVAELGAAAARRRPIFLAWPPALHPLIAGDAWFVRGLATVAVEAPTVEAAWRQFHAWVACR